MTTTGHHHWSRSLPLISTTGRHLWPPRLNTAAGRPTGYHHWLPPLVPLVSTTVHHYWSPLLITTAARRLRPPRLNTTTGDHHWSPPLVTTTGYRHRYNMPPAVLRVASTGRRRWSPLLVATTGWWGWVWVLGSLPGCWQAGWFAAACWQAASLAGCWLLAASRQALNFVFVDFIFHRFSHILRLVSSILNFNGL